MDEVWESASLGRPRPETSLGTGDEKAHSAAPSGTSPTSTAPCASFPFAHGRHHRHLELGPPASLSTV